MVGIQWDILKPRNVAGDIMQAFEQGQELGRQNRLRGALAALAGGEDPEALRTVYALGGPQLGAAVENQHFQRGERRRQAEARSAYADYLTGAAGPSQVTPPASPDIAALMGPGPDGGATAAQALAGELPAGVRPTDTLPPMPSTVADNRRAAFERHARVDPAGAAAAREQYTKMTRAELEAQNEMNEAGLRILSSVRDQASYDVAKQRARELWQRFGHDTSALDQLPAEFSPDLVRQLQMEAMSAKDQFAALLNERNVESQIDYRADRIDTFRENNQSLDDYRQGQLTNQRRGQDIRSRDTRRGQDVTDRRQRERPAGGNVKPSPTVVLGRIHEKIARGEQLTRGEQILFDMAQRRSQGGGRGRVSARDRNLPPAGQ